MDESIRKSSPSVDVNQSIFYFNSPLTIAVDYKNSEFVKTLLKKGAICNTECLFRSTTHPEDIGIQIDELIVTESKNRFIMKNHTNQSITKTEQKHIT